jgi:DNA primase
MAFPDSFVEEVRRTADVVRVISDQVALKKMGNSWKGLCPFHNEKTPSFNVRAEPPIFHCFGCGAGGDVFKFVMLHERVGFPEAVESLARRFGIAVPESPTSAPIARSARDPGREAAAAQHSAHPLDGSGHGAREYLLGRGWEGDEERTAGPPYDSGTTSLACGQVLPRPS